MISRRRLLELALALTLAVGWVVAYLVARRDLAAATPASRRFLLELYSTAPGIEWALVLGLAACVVAGAREWWPLPSLAAVCVLVAIVELRYPMVARSSIVPELTIAIPAFWAASRSRKPLIEVLPLAVGGLLVGTIPAYSINPRFDALSGVSSGRLTALGDSLLAVLIAALAVAGGITLHRILAQADELEQQNRELDAQNSELTEARQTIAVRAVEGERVRIARELHDVVAHHVTTMTLHAGAARQVARLSESETSDGTVSALHQIETSGREAVAELHRLLGFLRGSDQVDDRAPAPDLSQLDRLAESTDDLAVMIDVQGEVDGIPPSVGLSAYRIVQEALTNVRKHAGANRAEIELQLDAGAVAISVTDDGSAAVPSSIASPGSVAVPSGSGLGLVGMRERVTLHGGDLEVGPTVEGGWRVWARLPYEPRVESPDDD